MTKNTKDQTAYLQAKRAYHEGTHPTMTDAAFDKLEDALKLKHPEWAPLFEARTPTAPLGKKHDVRFAVAMPSLDKVYTDEARLAGKIDTLRSRDPSLFEMPKYDGSSILLTYRGGDLVEAVTGGDATVGKSVKHLIPHFRNVPLSIEDDRTIHFRCEAIIPIKHHKKLSGPARAIVSGALNRKAPEVAVLNLVEFVVLRVFHPSLETITEGRALAREYGFTASEMKKVDKTKLTGQHFSAALATLRENFGYETDGLVLVANTAACDEEPQMNNPKCMFAVKENAGERFDTRVEEIVWQASRLGYLTPKARIQPVTFKSGHTVTFATLHNAAWARDRKIGPGAVVTVLRSGEVIPKIVAVPTPGVFTEPNKKTHGAWWWDGLEIKLIEQGTEGRIREYVYLLDLIGMKSVGKASVEAYLNTVPQDDECPSGDEFILELLASPEVTLRRLGFTPATAKKMAATAPVALSHEQVMLLSGKFGEGFGTRRCTKILKLVLAAETRRSEFVDAIGEAFGSAAYDNLPSFKRWLADNRKQLAPFIDQHDNDTKEFELGKKAPASQLLKGQVVSFTGYRDKDQEAWVADNGGVVKEFSAKTTILFISVSGKPSAKAEKARAAGVTVAYFAHLKQGTVAVPAIK